MMSFNRKRGRGGCILVLFCVLAGMSLGETSPDSTDQEFAMESLRDPFWPVGFFPDGWRTKKFGDGTQDDTSGFDWGPPSKLIHVKGTSRMKNQTVVIINNEFKAPGDFIEVRYNGQIYEWEILDVNPGGKVSLRRNKVRSERNDF